MFKRTYFMKVNKIGRGSYTFRSSTPTIRSFFPKPLIVYKETLEFLINELRTEPGSSIEVEAFNRV